MAAQTAPSMASVTVVISALEPHGLRLICTVALSTQTHDEIERIVLRDVDAGVVSNQLHDGDDSVGQHADPPQVRDSCVDGDSQLFRFVSREPRGHPATDGLERMAKRLDRGIVGGDRVRIAGHSDAPTQAAHRAF